MIDENQASEEALPEDPDVPVVRCIICSETYSSKQIDNLKACLKCGTKAMPMPVDGDIENVKVNWLELMILVEWAENFANIISQQNRGDKSAINIIGAIAKRLSIHKKPNYVPLLMVERMMAQRGTTEAPRIIVPPPGIGGDFKLKH